MKHVILIGVVVIGLVLGIAGIVLGEADDSPGLQGLGGLLVLGAIVVGVKAARRSGPPGH